MTRLWQATLILAAVVSCQAAPFAIAAEPMSFITRRGDQLLDGQQQFRFISFNIPNLMVIEDAYEFTRPNPWRWPSEFEIEDALESVRQMGGQVVRTYVLSVFREGSDMGDLVHVRRPGEFNEEGFRSLDKVIEVARRKGIRVIIPFVDQAKWWGGVGEYAAFRGKPAEAFWNDQQIIDDFKATIRFVLERKNTFTGVAYRDEPAIFGWETGNEIMPTPAWTRQIAAYLKELDRNHIVLDGKSLHGLPLTSLDDPNIDVVSTHHYPFGDDHDFSRPIREAHALTKGKKAYFVGEFGFVETPHLASAIQTVLDDGISGALLWSLRMHRREGGFYWHMEVGTGRNIYKAFHWPGFGSGSRYDEQTVMQLMRYKAFEIRGLQPPALEPPLAPTLLPIVKASAISWQGSAGATGYDIWRAEAATGPWTKVADNVSDAEVQYRPLFHDLGAEPGKSYWYRVVARNPAGESAASNAAGPVAVKLRSLVDECRDLTLTAANAGVIIPMSENARTVQEDCHRLALEPGAEVVYHVSGAIDNWTVYSFAQSSPQLEFETSADGRSFRAVNSRSREFAYSQTVYGYSTPFLFTGGANDGDRFLKIKRRKTDATSTAAGQRDRKVSTKPPLVELSRVEIEFGGAEQRGGSPPTETTRAAAPLNSAVFVDPSRPIDDTLRTIDDAARHGERQLNVVVSVLVDLTKELRIKAFGSSAGESLDFEECTASTQDALRDKLERVFARMVERDLAIYVLPHIDAGGAVQEWRNWVDFDPLTPHEGYSYQGLVLDSIVESLSKTIKPETHVELSLSGEMGTSLFRYPESYRKIVQRLRERPELRRMKIGVSLNHNDIAGQNYPTRAKDVPLTDSQRARLQELLDDCDFIGMSCYVPVSIPPVTEDFVRGIEKFLGEFKQLGLVVPVSKPLQLSEVGIGGRHLRHGKAILEKAAQAPWEGTGDPANSPWADEAMKRFRRQYHAALLEFLEKQPAANLVTVAFFWSTGSWDPWGHGQGEFADTEITAAIERHNRRTARGAPQ